MLLIANIYYTPLSSSIQYFFKESVTPVCYVVVKIRRGSDNINQHDLTKGRQKNVFDCSFYQILLGNKLISKLPKSNLFRDNFNDCTLYRRPHNNLGLR